MSAPLDRSHGGPPESHAARDLAGELHGRHRTGVAQARPVDASMGLLHDLMKRPVEAGYAEAASQPPGPVTPAVRARRTAVHLVIAIVLGVVTVSAITVLRTPQPSALASRTLLEEEIAHRAADADELQQGVETLSAEIGRLQSDALEDASPALFAELEEAELLSGAVAVTGPGLVLEVDDAPESDDSQDDAQTRVQDLDLQILTNGLWASGAEAMAINGQRLTAVSAIRGAGPAIFVDLAPLIAPYRIEVIGDVRAMQTAFARTSAAGHLSTLTGTYGITATMKAQQSLTLPGSGSSTLRYAQVLGDDVASSAQDDEEGSP